MQFDDILALATKHSTEADFNYARQQRELKEAKERKEAEALIEQRRQRMLAATQAPPAQRSSTITKTKDAKTDDKSGERKDGKQHQKGFSRMATGGNEPKKATKHKLKASDLSFEALMARASTSDTEMVKPKPRPQVQEPLKSEIADTKRNDIGESRKAPHTLVKGDLESYRRSASPSNYMTDRIAPRHRLNDAGSITSKSTSKSPSPIVKQARSNLVKTKPPPSPYTQSGRKSIDESTLSLRERLKLKAFAPPEKLNVTKRDRRSVEEIQEELAAKKRQRLAETSGMVSLGPTEEPVTERPPASKRQVGEKRVSEQKVRPKSAQKSTLSASVPEHPESRLSAQKRQDEAPISRPRPFEGRQPSNAAGLSAAERVRQSRLRDRERERARREGRAPRPIHAERGRYEEEEEDSDLADFIADDDEEEDLEGNYSSVISKMFGYNRNRYKDEAFSDDDMEADASQLRREEMRSARLAREEDKREEERERLEAERAKQRKLAKQKANKD
ncbi:hypothetical protein BZG36_00590 [Bifiguratus adelaidae]|uniref:SPT2 chromatin protein n=1 Tax=Bifiguratus adelaidae TaxID=1938954 RepID=A0A261Y747_9FUNG|nr:hypothetical protein BZG36_00590 [Bifiguratus adelaidae]